MINLMYFTLFIPWRRVRESQTFPCFRVFEGYACGMQKHSPYGGMAIKLIT